MIIGLRKFGLYVQIYFIRAAISRGFIAALAKNAIIAHIWQCFSKMLKKKAGINQYFSSDRFVWLAGSSKSTQSRIDVSLKH